MATLTSCELAPFERVVNFALLDRDFEAGREELTPKGTLRRKVIEEHFAEAIEGLYQNPDGSAPDAGIGDLRIEPRDTTGAGLRRGAPRRRSPAK